MHTALAIPTLMRNLWISLDLNEHILFQEHVEHYINEPCHARFVQIWDAQISSRCSANNTIPFSKAWLLQSRMVWRMVYANAKDLKTASLIEMVENKIEHPALYRLWPMFTDIQKSAIEEHSPKHSWWLELHHSIGATIQEAINALEQSER